jgi:hypothetical protein
MLIYATYEKHLALTFFIFAKILKKKNSNNVKEDEQNHYNNLRTKNINYYKTDSKDCFYKNRLCFVPKDLI